MLLVLEQVPVEAARLAPLAPLAELAAHEQQLLPWMRVHVAVECAQIRKLLPKVAGHLVQQRPLQVHDFVVRQRQNEVLAERVHERERDGVVLITPEDRVL